MIDALPKILYHVGPRGLEALSPSPFVRRGFTDAGVWADTVYGKKRPIFLSSEQSMYKPTSKDQCVYEVKSVFLEKKYLITDLPSLVDYRMYVTEDIHGNIIAYWEEGEVPPELSPILSAGEIKIRKLLHVWQKTFAVTKTVGYMADITPLA